MKCAGALPICIKNNMGKACDVIQQAMVGRRVRARYCFVYVCAAVMLMTGCASLTGQRRPQPDWVQTSACAPYRPVDKPGMERREAQNDAEVLARRALLNEVGRMRVQGRQTVNDIIARDRRLRAEVLRLVRTAEVEDWQVDEVNGQVCVWIKLDKNRVRELFLPNDSAH